MTVYARTDNSSALLYSFHATDLDTLWQEFKSFDLTVMILLGTGYRPPDAIAYL